MNFNNPKINGIDKNLIQRKHCSNKQYKIIHFLKVMKRRRNRQILFLKEKIRSLKKQN